MNTLRSLALIGAIALTSAACSADYNQSAPQIAVEDTRRTAANVERDSARKPAEVLNFIGLKQDDTVLDYGSGGGYWAELFAGAVGDGGKVYAHNSNGQRFESRKEALVKQYEAFKSIELMPVGRGETLPIADGSVDTIMLSYLIHHLHYQEASGDALPDSSVALFEEFRRVLKPGGSFIIIEHVAQDGASRAQSAQWHRTPPELAKADLMGLGFEFVADAPAIYFNPDDDLANNWNEAGLRGKTTSFVHKYRKP